MAERHHSRAPAAAVPAPGPELPERARMGLLDYVTAHSLDEDYAHVSAQRTDTSTPVPGRARRSVLTLAVLALFGVLVATAAVQTARTEPLQRRSQESLAAQVRERRAELTDTRTEVVDLRAQIVQEQQAALDASRTGRRLQDQLRRLGTVTGAGSVAGPGVRISVDNAPEDGDGPQIVLDTDLQLLVNGLWASGAEAVSINAQRLTTLSSIRVAGQAITVNRRSLTRPYVVSAIGDPDQLPARFLDSDAGTWWLNLKSLYNLEFDMTTEDSLTVPAAPDLELDHARPLGTKR